MSAFLIADVNPRDMAAYRDSGYLEAVPEIAARFGGVYRARGGQLEKLEGDWQPQRLIVIEFPSWDQLQAFYQCAEYQPYREFLPASKDSIPVSKGSTNKDTRRSGREKTLQISDIRRDSNKRNSMRASVKTKLHAVNAVLESDSEDEGISHLSGKLRSCTIRNQISGKHGGRKGRKNSDNDDPIFPNDVLGPQHAVKPGKRSVEFQDLNLRLLCLGESMICSSGVLDAEEVQGRLSWLSHLLTYAKSYKFSAILTLHEEMIHQVHFGERTWFDDHASLVAQIVIPHPLSFDDKKGKSDKSDKSKGFTYFCGKFNSEDGCDEQDRHKMFFKGEYVTAHHVCSSCLVKDKKQFNHSRMSDICPHKK